MSSWNWTFISINKKMKQYVKHCTCRLMLAAEGYYLMDVYINFSTGIMYLIDICIGHCNQHNRMQY